MSGNEFVLVCAGRSYKASARLVFRDLGKQFSLSDNVIGMIHERYMVLVHLDEHARSTIRAALQRYLMTWIREAPAGMPENEFGLEIFDFDEDI